MAKMIKAKAVKAKTKVKTSTDKKEISPVEKVVEQEVTVELLDSIPEEVSNDFLDLYGRLNVHEITQINPLIPVLNEIQRFKSVVYDPENEEESVQEYKDAIKYLGSFNTSIKNIKRELKAPHKEIMDKIENVFKHLSNEYTNSRNALMVNFQPYLDEKERIKKEAEDKKKEKELQMIKELEEKNKEILEKQKAQNSKINYLTFSSNLNNFFQKEMQELNDSDSKQFIIDKLGHYRNLSMTDILSVSVTDSLTNEYFEKLHSEYTTITESLIDFCEKRIQKLNELEKAQSVPPSPVEIPESLKSIIPDNLMPDMDPELTPIEYMMKLCERLDNYKILITKESEALRDDVSFNDHIIETTRKQLINDVFPKMIDQVHKTKDWIMLRIERSKTQI